MQKVVTRKQVRMGFIKLFSVGFVFNLCVARFFWNKVAADKNIGNSLLLFVPLILIVFYWWWYKSYAIQDEFKRDQFADSLYFLGFLFTLMHLSFALVPWVFNAQMDSFYILAQFGMAITTTLTGLFLRVMTSLFRNDVTSSIESQESLGAASAAFIAQLEISTLRLKEYHEKSIPYLDEQAKAFVKVMREVSDDAIAEMRKTRTAFGATTSKTMQNLTTKLDQIFHDTEDSAHQQVEIAKEFGHAMAAEVRTTCTSILSSFKGLTEQTLGETEGILNRLKRSVETIDVQISSKMQLICEELDQSTVAIKNYRERSQEILVEVNRNALVEMQGAVKTAKDGLQEVIAGAVGAVEKVTRISVANIGEAATEITQRWRDDLSGLIVETKELLTSLSQSIATMLGSAQQMENANLSIVNIINDGVIKLINDASEGLGKLNEQAKTMETRFGDLAKVMESFRSLGIVMQEMTKALENTNIAFQRINQEAVETNVSLQEELRRTNRLREQLSVELATSAELTQQVHMNLVKGLQFVVRELGRPSQ